MFDRTKINLRRKAGILVFTLVIVGVLGPMETGVLSAFQSSSAEGQEKPGAETLQKLKIASVQHDLILLLIENRNFDRVELEWRKVLDLRLSGKYEGAIAQSLLTISYKLFEAKQLSLAQKILSESLSAVPFSNKNKADILRFQAYLYKEAGDLNSAIDTLKRASELAERP
jgi:tetratricopeptide (TPR) repeat protein